MFFLFLAAHTEKPCNVRFFYLSKNLMRQDPLEQLGFVVGLLERKSECEMGKSGLSKYREQKNPKRKSKKVIG